ncbi:hypothetical protein FOS14_22185 [Skermania sp. ID1734]|nr:hypothetical protein FOS14_22185 [Skermania sp. ID1734]
MAEPVWNIFLCDDCLLTSAPALRREATKIENPVNAHKAGIATGLAVEPGAAITQETCSHRSSRECSPACLTVVGLVSGAIGRLHHSNPPVDRRRRVGRDRAGCGGWFAGSPR